MTRRCLLRIPKRVRVKNRLVLNGNLSQDLNFTFPFGEFSNAHLDLLDITLGFPRSGLPMSSKRLLTQMDLRFLSPFLRLAFCV